ncbi:5-carboxymethyl-2-hydroxymuconate Delta-isomerase [Thalassotalea ganghwensis]
MPHCIIEHSSDIDAQPLIEKVYLGALNANLFAADGSDIKLRTMAYEHYQTGEERQSFVHVNVRILSGRNQQQKSHLSDCVISKLKLIGLRDASLTVEVIDIDRDSYAKALV